MQMTSDPEGKEAAPLLAAGSGPNHKIVVRPGARSVVFAFGTDAPNAAELEPEGPTNVARFTDEEGRFGKGVPGFMDSLDGLFCWMRAVSQDMPVRFIGEGSGATAVLAAGLILPRAEMLAVNPMPLPATRTDGPQDGRIPHPFWGDLATVARLFPARQMGITAFSAWDPANAMLLSREDALPPAFGTIVELPCSGRGMAYLRRKGALTALMSRGVDAIRTLREENILHPRSSLGKAKQFELFHQTHVALASGSSGRKRALRLIESEVSWGNPGWQHLRATVLRREKVLPEALEASRKAAHIGSDVVEFCVSYAKLVLEGGMLDEAAQAAACLEPFVRQRGVRELRDSLATAK